MLLKHQRFLKCNLCSKLRCQNTNTFGKMHQLSSRVDRLQNNLQRTSDTNQSQLEKVIDSAITLPKRDALMSACHPDIVSTNR